jgi:hypothetical protein
MKKISLSLFLFAASLFVLEANELSPKDFGLESEAEIREFCVDLEKYGFAKGLFNDPKNSFGYKVEEFIEYMYGIPGLNSFSPRLFSAFKRGVYYASEVDNALQYSTILAKETEKIKNFEQKYRRVINSFLDKKIGSRAVRKITLDAERILKS